MSQSYIPSKLHPIRCIPDARIQTSEPKMNLYNTSQSVKNVDLLLVSGQGSFANPRQGCARLLLPAPGAGPVWIRADLHPSSSLALTLAKRLRALPTAIHWTFPVQLYLCKDKALIFNVAKHQLTTWSHGRERKMFPPRRRLFPEALRPLTSTVDSVTKSASAVVSVVST